MYSLHFFTQTDQVHIHDPLYYAALHQITASQFDPAKCRPYTWLASAILPAMAEAVTVAADPRYTFELGFPARPLKLRVPVLIRTSF